MDSKIVPVSSIAPDGWGPKGGGNATSPLHSRGSPTKGTKSELTPAVSGIPTAAERGAKSEMAHLWAKWLRNPCRLGDPHRLRAGGKIRSGPLVGKVATSPLPSRGSPPPQSWGAESELAHLWARWLHNPCRLGDPHRLKAGGRIRKRPTSGQGGYITPLGAFGARWLLGLIPLTTNCRPEAPWGGGGGSWRPRTHGVAPPGMSTGSRQWTCPRVANPPLPHPYPTPTAWHNPD